MRFPLTALLHFLLLNSFAPLAPSWNGSLPGFLTTIIANNKACGHWNKTNIFSHLHIASKSTFKTYWSTLLTVGKCQCFIFGNFYWEHSDLLCHHQSFTFHIMPWGNYDNFSPDRHIFLVYVLPTTACCIWNVWRVAGQLSFSRLQAPRLVYNGDFYLHWWSVWSASFSHSSLLRKSHWCWPVFLSTFNS